MKHHQFLLFLAWIFILVIALSACSPRDDILRQAVGKWETIYVQVDGYGTKLDMRVELDIKKSGQCLQRTYSVLSGKLYEMVSCSIETKENGMSRVIYDNGQSRQIGFEGNQLVFFNVGRVVYYGGPHLKFDRVMGLDFLEN